MRDSGQSTGVSAKNAAHPLSSLSPQCGPLSPDLHIGSLFSGVGGLELGLEWSGLGHTVWQVERDPFCAAVLAKHWPDARRFDDVCTVGAAELAPVDLICGGFPCQDVSSAGKGLGLAGERSGLWREFARIVGELQPRWVVVENVASGAGRWFDAVVRELEDRGYAVLPLPISARDVGAPHLRERLFIVAHADGNTLRDQQQRLSGGRSSGLRDEGQTKPGDDGSSRCPADADGSRKLQPEGREQALRRRTADGAPANSAQLGAGRRHLPAWEPDTTRVAPGGERWPSVGWGSPKSGVVPLVHGLSGGLAGRRRRARIRALGNAVVPQCAEVVGWVIRELLEAEKARRA